MLTKERVSYIRGYQIQDFSLPLFLGKWKQQELLIWPLEENSWNLIAFCANNEILLEFNGYRTLYIIININKINTD